MLRRVTGRTRRIALVAAAIVSAGAAYTLLFETDQDVVESRLALAAHIINGRSQDETPNDRLHRIRRQIEPLLAQHVVVTIPEFPRGLDRPSLFELLASDKREKGHFSIELSNVAVRVAGPRATAQGTATLVWTSPATQEQDLRRFVARFEDRDGNWLLSSLDVGRRTHEQPEARP
jgi:hypothetical protein